DETETARVRLLRSLNPLREGDVSFYHELLFVPSTSPVPPVQVPCAGEATGAQRHVATAASSGMAARRIDTPKQLHARESCSENKRQCAQIAPFGPSSLPIHAFKEGICALLTGHFNTPKARPKLFRFTLR
ncbi:hypothetical protein BN1723_012433, partial [Verticillium longisporum]